MFYNIHTILNVANYVSTQLKQYLLDKSDLIQDMTFSFQ
jgi:hypothetical protein